MINSTLATPPPYISPARSSPSPSPIPQSSPIYTNDIPVFYDQSRLNYPCKPPHEYSDEEFERLNHFEFLRALSFSEPPLLPPYLNSNLLNDSSNKNYKQLANQSFNGGINDTYRYRINDLNIMDKYSTMKPIRPLLKRSGSSTSSSSSLRSSKSLRSHTHNGRQKQLRNEVGNSNNNKVKRMEKSQTPHHVMLNHLITCNMNREGYITSSCISRYNGKFITHIMYFATDMEDSV